MTDNVVILCVKVTAFVSFAGVRRIAYHREDIEHVCGINRRPIE